MYKTIVATSMAALLATSALAQQAPRDAGSAPPAGAPSVNEKATAPTPTPTNEKAIPKVAPPKQGVSEGTDKKGTKSSSGTAEQPKAAGTAEPKAKEATDQKPANADKQKTVEPKPTSVPAAKGAEKTETTKTKESTDQKPGSAETQKTVEPKATTAPSTKGAAEKTDSSTPAQRSGLGGAKNSGDTGGGSVVITQERRTQVQSVFVKYRTSAPRVTISVEPRLGVVIPRTITLVEIPEDIVVIVPEYRRYRYFIIDNQVCIVDTATYTIVDVIILA